MIACISGCTCCRALTIIDQAVVLFTLETPRTTPRTNSKSPSDVEVDFKPLKIVRGEVSASIIRTEYVPSRSRGADP